MTWETLHWFWKAYLLALLILPPILVTIIHACQHLRVRRVGGIWFWRFNSVGGSFYLTRKAI